MREQITRALEVDAEDVFEVDGLLDLNDLWDIVKIPGHSDLRDPPWTPVTQPALQPDEDEQPDVLGAMRKRDILLHHPYDSFVSSVERFVEQAVNDPDVLAIKQTVYRTSDDSPLVPALIRAAERGKQAVCLVEVKARFDERANIQWGRALEEAGVHVVYGLPSLKTHAKCILVVRREGDGVRHYLHVGTGNYNAKTARLYTDFGLLTCDEEIGADVADMFNFLTGFARPRGYRSVLVAPAHLRNGIIEEIERTIAARQEGRDARIRMKMNSLVDRECIQALYRASQAGVPVEINTRGICCLKPGVPGVSENIRVVSVVGRFLEHSRIYAFERDGECTVYIGSADLMPRNLDTRVELLTPIRDDAAARRPGRHAGPLLRRQHQRLGARRRGQLAPPHAGRRRAAQRAARADGRARRRGGRSDRSSRRQTSKQGSPPPHPIVDLGGRAACPVLGGVAQRAGRRRGAQVAQRAVLGAADPARRDAQHAGGLARCVRRLGAEAEAQLEDAALEAAEAGEHVAEVGVHARDGGGLLGRRAFVGQQVAELGVARVADRGLERDRGHRDPADVGDVGLRPLERVGELGGGRGGAERHREPALDGLQLAYAVTHVHGQPNGAALLRHRAADGLADPQRGVGGEAEPAAVVELLDRPHEPDRPLLDQVQERHSGVLALEALGEMDDEAQVGLDHAVLGFEVTALDAARELELLGRGQQTRAGDALEEDSEAVAELASVRGRRRSGGHSRAASTT